MLPPSIVSTLPPLQLLPLNQRSSPHSSSTLPLPPLPPSMLPPSNVYYGQQPSNVTLVRTPFNASLPLPTMLTHFTDSLPPYPFTSPSLLTLTLQSHTRHRTRVIIGPSTLTTFLQSTCIPSTRDAWPSGATDTCLSHPNRPLTRYARYGQLVLEYLWKTICSPNFVIGTSRFCQF